MNPIRHLGSRIVGRTPDPDVVEARKVLDEKRQTTARINRVIIDIDARAWGKSDRPIEDNMFPEQRPRA